MKSTGEVMGLDTSFGMAFAKSQQGAGHTLPMEGTVFISVRNADKRDIIFIAKKLEDLGLMKNEQICLVINTVSGKNPRRDEIHIRTHAIANNIPLISTLSAAGAFVNGIEALKKRGITVKPLQDYA